MVRGHRAVCLIIAIHFIMVTSDFEVYCSPQAPCRSRTSGNDRHHFWEHGRSRNCFQVDRPHVAPSHRPLRQPDAQYAAAGELCSPPLAHLSTSANEFSTFFASQQGIQMVSRICGRFREETKLRLWCPRSMFERIVRWVDCEDQLAEIFRRACTSGHGLREELFRTLFPVDTWQMVSAKVPPPTSHPWVHTLWW